MECPECDGKLLSEIGRCGTCGATHPSLLTPDTSDQTTGTLLPCPFCGNPPTTADSWSGNLLVKCEEFECPCGKSYVSPRAWNTRAVPSVEQEGKDEHAAAQDNSKSSSLTPTAPNIEDGNGERLTAETRESVEANTRGGQMARALDSSKVGIAVYCTVCGLRKKPWGRSAPLATANSLCDSDCNGYGIAPLVGALWPDECEKDFGYPCGDEGTNKAPHLSDNAPKSSSAAGVSLENPPDLLGPVLNPHHPDPANPDTYVPNPVSAPHIVGDGEKGICKVCGFARDTHGPDAMWTHRFQKVGDGEKEKDHHG